MAEFCKRWKDEQQPLCKTPVVRFNENYSIPRADAHADTATNPRNQAKLHSYLAHTRSTLNVLERPVHHQLLSVSHTVYGIFIAQSGHARDPRASI